MVTLKKIYNIPIINKPGEDFQGMTIDVEKFRKAAENYMNPAIRMHRCSLLVAGGPRDAYLNGVIEKIEDDNVVFACKDKATIKYLDDYIDSHSALICHMPYGKDRDIFITDFIYLPIKPTNLFKKEN